MNSMEHYNNFMNTFSADERQNILTNCNDLEKNALIALSFGLPLSDSQQEIITNIFRNLNILNRNSVNGKICDHYEDETVTITYYKWKNF